MVVYRSVECIQCGEPQNLDEPLLFLDNVIPTWTCEQCLSKSGQVARRKPVKAKRYSIEPRRHRSAEAS